MNVSFRGVLVQLNRIDEKESEKIFRSFFFFSRMGSRAFVDKTGVCQV
jgi:hypothetical protein